LAVHLCGIRGSSVSEGPSCPPILEVGPILHGGEGLGGCKSPSSLPGVDWTKWSGVQGRDVCSDCGYRP
jgi:hypothetical protein